MIAGVTVPAQQWIVFVMMLTLCSTLRWTNVGLTAWSSAMHVSQTSGVTLQRTPALYNIQLLGVDYCG